MNHKAKAKALALGAVLGSVLLAGCGPHPKVVEHLTMLDSQVAEAQKTADEAMRMVKAADHVAHHARSLAEAADEVARTAISCCDANSNRLNTMFHKMQMK